MSVNQWGAIQCLGWCIVLIDGWILQTNVLAGVGLLVLLYSLRRMAVTAKTPEDEEFERIGREQSAREAMTSWLCRKEGIEGDFAKYMDSPGPQEAGDTEVLRHFRAGWMAGSRKEWSRESND